MAAYYVIFNGKHAGIYLSWHECSKYILGEKGIVHKKFNTHDRAVRAFQEYIRDEPFDPIVPVMPDDGDAGDGGCWKKVFVTSVVVLVLGLWLITT